MDIASHITPKTNGIPIESVPDDYASPRKRKSYSHQFKLDAVRMTYEGTHTVAELGRMLNINESLLHRWRREIGAEALETRPSETAIADVESGGFGAAVLQHLYDELQRLREERDVLKHAIAILVKSQE